MATLSLWLAGGVLLGLAVLWTAPAYACGPSTFILAKPAQADPGSTVEVVGSSFRPGIPVAISWDGAATSAAAGALPDEHGHFRTEITVPVIEPGLTVMVASQDGLEEGSQDGLDVRFQFRVLVDETPPAWPDEAVLAAAGVTESGVALSWPAAADVLGVETYRVMRDGSEIAETSGTSLHVTGLAPGTTYAFAVQAHDAAGNVSADALSVVVTTAGSIPTDPSPADPGDPSPADPDTTEVCSATAAASVFTDIAGSVHREAIDCAASHGIARGTSATTYSPGRSVRRDQMASFIARLLARSGVELPVPRGQRFTDIAGNQHAEAINQLAELGVVAGVTPTTYAPAAPVRRDQMASFLVRAYELAGGRLAGGSPPFTDVAGNTHEAAIGKAHRAGLARGVSEATYAPADLVRRDQMAAFLTRVLERLLDVG